MINEPNNLLHIPMKKVFVFLLLSFISIISYAEDIPDPNGEGIKKVQGVISDNEYVNTSRRGSNASATTGNPGLDVGVNIIEAIFGTNYTGFPIYHVKVSEAITLDVASREPFKIGDCVLVWYDGAMGDSPDLSMPGQAGIAKSNACKK